MASYEYVEIRESEVPARVRFDVPGRLQGQIVEIAYGGWSRGEHDEGDPYQRVTDRSLVNSRRYYKRVDHA